MFLDVSWQILEVLVGWTSGDEIQRSIKELCGGGSVRLTSSCIAFIVEESDLQQFCTSEVLHVSHEIKETSVLLSFKYRNVPFSMLFSSL